MSRLLPVATAARTRRALGELLRPARGAVLGALALLVAATAAGLVVAPLLGRAVDAVDAGVDAEALTPVLAVLVVLAAVQGGLTVAGVAVLGRVGEALLARLREAFVDRALALPLETLERGGSGDLVARVSDDVTAVGVAVRDALPQMITALLLMIMSLGALIVLDWRFAVVAVVVAPLQAAAARWYLRASTPVYAESRVAEGAQQAQLLASIADAESVRALRLTDPHVALAEERIGRTSHLSFVASELETRFFGRLNVAEVLGLLIVLAGGFLLVRAEQLTIGTAGAAALYLVSLFRPVSTALLLLDPIQSATAGLARVVGVLDLPAEPPPPAGGPIPRDGGLELVDVGFGYGDGPPAVREVTVAVPAGASVALVGASGAGKSTLAKVVAGVLSPDTGTIRIGGADVGGLGPTALRRAVALVTQEVHVFAGPLAADLRLVRPDATDADLARVLAAVGADAWVDALPDGLDTVVGDGGHPLTVVQAQQLALARLELADPLVAILDEATAEAGSAGAAVLDAASRTVLRDRTGVVVAHRLSQAAAADLVVVLEAGRITEVGTHERLAAGSGHYAELWAAWTARGIGEGKDRP